MTKERVHELEKGKQYKCLICHRSYAIIPIGFYKIGELYTWNPRLKAWTRGTSPIGMRGWPMHKVPAPRYYGKCELVETHDSDKRVPKAIES